MATKYTKEVLEEAARNSTSVMGVLRYLGRPQAGGNHSHIKRQLDKFGIDTSHFTGRGHNAGKSAGNRKSPSEILILFPEGSNRPKPRQLKRAMIESGMEYKCACGLTNEWQGTTLVLEVDHIDGNWLNNRLENLRFICPNCHSQTPTSRSWKNKGV